MTEKKEFADPKILEDGKVLLALKQQFLKNNTDENLFLFLTCMRDSVVQVPMVPLISEEEKARLEKGDTVLNGSVMFRPDLHYREDLDLLFFPFFSQKEQIPGKYLDRVTVFPVSVLRCIELAEAGNADSFVLDPYTQPMAIPMHIAKKIPSLPSALSEEDQKALLL